MSGHWESQSAPFGIDFILVEPGPNANNFGAGLVRASPMEIY
jgi:hypothetical protein